MFSFSSSLQQSDIFSQVPEQGSKKFLVYGRATDTTDTVLKDHLHILRSTVRYVQHF